jgi:putative transposase
MAERVDRRKRYSDERRRTVLADVARLGVRGAGREHGVPSGTVARWKAQVAALAAALAQSEQPAEPSAATESESKASAVPAFEEARTHSRRRYSKAERRAVLADVPVEGISGAARKHGVPKGTVANWWVKEKPTRSQSGEASTGGKGEAAATIEVEPAGQADAGARSVKKRIAKTYTPSQKAAILEYAAANGVTAAAKEFVVSRFSVYEWERQVKRAAAGDGESPTSGPEISEIEAQRDAEILAEWHRHPGLGPSQIRNQLRRKSVKVSVHTTRRVMQEAGYRPPKVTRKPHDERFEAVRPNHMWHLDYVNQHINRASTFNLILIDDHSRYVVGHGVDDAERADMVIETFEEAVGRFGRPEMVMHDKGSAFWSWRGISRFTKLLVEMGIDQIAAEHKEWNGKVEVFNANLQKELFKVHRFHDVAEMKRRLASHLWWYNHQRTHHALGGLLVPADRYYGRADEVLARIETGAGRGDLDALDLRDRRLDLFKLVSKNGVPEIWLMGQRLFELRA